jgi:nitrogen fixation/metabolism regulation signal transduction histidine kinase
MQQLNVGFDLIFGIKMRMSRFQLKLTLIFLLVLLVPAITATLLTKYILTIQSTVMDVDQKAEAVLQETKIIADDIIEKAKEECLFIAQAISDNLTENNVNLDSAPQQELVKGIVQPGQQLNAIILSSGNPIIKPKIIFATSNDNKDLLDSVSDKLKNQEPSSYQDGDLVYGVTPLINNGKQVAFVVVYKQLEEGLVRNVVDLQKLLGIYALKEDVEHIIWIFVVGLIIVFAILGTLLATFLAKSVTKPLLNLVAGTKEIAKGNLDYRVEAKGKDEIATLIESFNLMASQLKSSRDRLMMTERVAAWQDVARQIAHEIKNLLSPIQLSMYRLKKNLGSERYGEIFEQSYSSITNEVENLKNMVTEFSNFAKKPKPRLNPSSINEIIQNALNLYNELPENIEIKADLVDNLPQFMADVDQMRQVLHNLIGNAVDAMPEGGKLTITTRLDVDNIIMEIEDTGCGMSDEVIQRIWTPYFTTKEKGTGLGMAIVAQIVGEHGGEISVESQQGVGTKVTIKLKAVAELSGHQ